MPNTPILLLTLTMTAAGAGLPAPTAAVENTRQLQGTLTADRDTYFPGEAAMFTLTLKNPSSGSLEVPEPYSSANSCFELRKLLEGGVSLPLSARPICPSRIVDTKSRSTAVLGAGEERQSLISSDTLMSGSEELSVSQGPAVLNRPGYYQIEYSYHHVNPSVVFRVVTPRLDTATVLKLPDITYGDPSTGRTISVPAYMHLFALRWNNQSYICISQSPDSSGRAVAGDAHGDFEGTDFPYVRIATSTEAIRSLNASVDAHDRLTVIWVDAAGHWQGKTLNGRMPETETGAVQIGLDSTVEKLTPSDTKQFTATVIGVPNAPLKWTVALAPGAPAGAATGTVSASGKYSAPATVTRPYQVILKARLQSDSTKSAIAMVHLAPPRRANTGGAARTAEAASPAER
jgi:hypothetical protein